MNTIISEQSNIRLDKYLADNTYLTRSQIQKLIKNKQIKVNNKFVRSSFKVNISDKIKIVQKTQQTAENSEKKATLKKSKLEIIFENKDFLIVNKPAGLLVHPTQTSTETTLVDLILKKYPQIAKIGEDPQRPGIVHRLDKQVSGLIVIARTQDSFDHLKTQFKTRKITKHYLALVYGKIEQANGTLDFLIKRKKSGLMSAVPISQQDEKTKTAITDYEIIQRYKNYTFVKAMPKTGRMHQIRVHFHAFNHPIVGDELYTQRKYKKKIELHRVFLHATYLKFTNVDNKEYEFNSPLPNNLQKILNTLLKITNV